MKLGYSLEPKWLPDWLCLVLPVLEKKKGGGIRGEGGLLDEDAPQLLICSAIVQPPPDPQASTRGGQNVGFVCFTLRGPEEAGVPRRRRR